MSGPSFSSTASDAASAEGRPSAQLLRPALELAGVGLVATFVFWATIVWASSVVLALALVAGWLVVAVVAFHRRPHQDLALLALSLVIVVACVELALRGGMLPGVQDYRPAAAEIEWGLTRHIDTQPAIQFPDPELGYRLVGPQRARSKLFHRGALVYDVFYTIDEAGFRVTPGVSTSGQPILVMGDSFQFGSGLPDEQTLGAHLASRSAGTLRPVNLATPGYGVHQILRQLQLGTPKASGVDQFDLLIFGVFDTHVRRASGKARWLRGSPRYETSAEGLAPAGVFQPSSQFAEHLLADSALAALLGEALDKFLMSDEKRFVAILKEIEREARATYGARLLVLYYSELNVGPSKRSAEKLLCRAGVSFIDLGTRVPITPDSVDKYYIAGDGHPTSALNDWIAREAIRYIEGHAAPDRCHP